MANKTTSYQNSQGVLFHQKAPVASSDLNEVQTVIENKLQATTLNIMMKWEINNSIINVTEINIKNKVVAQMEGVSFTLPYSLNRVHIFTRTVMVIMPTDTVYVYGLRSNDLTVINGSDQIGANNIIPDALGQQVSDRTLTEWTLVVTTPESNVPILSDWDYEGYLTLGGSSYQGAGVSNSVNQNPSFVVDYIISGSATLSNVDSVARQYSWSSRSLVLDLTGTYLLYQYDDELADWRVIGNVAQPDTIVYTADILYQARTVSIADRIPGYVSIYELDGELQFKIKETGNEGSSGGGGGNEYLPIYGGSMRGSIDMNGNSITELPDPLTDQSPVTRQYYERTLSTSLSSYLPLLGGTLTGPLNLFRDPTGDMEATTRKFVLSTFETPATQTSLGSVKIGSGLSIAKDGTLNKISYVLPIASSTTLGGVKIGSSLTIDSNGILNTLPMPIATSSSLGGVRVGANLSIDSSGVLSSVVPIASSTTLGGVKIGSGINISNGTISVTPYTLPTASSSVLGGVKIGSGINISNGTISVTPYTLPTASSSVLGGVKIGSGITISSGVISVATDYLKLSGGSLTGPLTLNANPTSNLQAAPKQYVDSKITYGTADLTAGTSNLETGTLYVVYR